MRSRSCGWKFKVSLKVKFVQKQPDSKADTIFPSLRESDMNSLRLRHANKQEKEEKKRKIITICRDLNFNCSLPTFLETTSKNP